MRTLRKRSSSVCNLPEPLQAGAIAALAASVFAVPYRRARISLRRSATSATLAPIRMSASVALRLPGAMQLMQLPMMAGASYTVGCPC